MKSLLCTLASLAFLGSTFAEPDKNQAGRKTIKKFVAEALQQKMYPVRHATAEAQADLLRIKLR